MKALPQEDRAFQQGQGFNPCPRSPEAGGKRLSLEQSQNQCTCSASRRYLCSLNSREKKANSYVPERNQCHQKHLSPVKEKCYPRLSLSVHCQRFSPRMGFNIGFPEFPVHHTTTLCDTGTSPVSLLGMECAQPWLRPQTCCCSAPRDGRRTISS